jgi:hypothetical protein
MDFHPEIFDTEETASYLVWPLACTHDQAGFEGAAGYDQLIGHW